MELPAIKVCSLSGMVRIWASMSGYDDDPDKRYPVLYMFDGHNVFFDSDATYGKSWGMKEFMGRSRRREAIFPKLWSIFL